MPLYTPELNFSDEWVEHLNFSTNLEMNSMVIGYDRSVRCTATSSLPEPPSKLRFLLFFLPKAI